MKWSVIVLKICVWSAYFSTDVNGAMTEQQVKAAVKLVRNMCQPKSKVSNEEIDKMHEGNWDVDRSAMCYMYCALSTNKLITKENTPNYEAAVALANKNLPATLKAPTLDSIEKCKDSAKTLDDNCVAAYEIAKCFYEANPDYYYFLP